MLAWHLPVDRGALGGFGVSFLEGAAVDGGGEGNKDAGDALNVAPAWACHCMALVSHIHFISHNGQQAKLPDLLPLRIMAHLFSVASQWSQRARLVSDLLASLVERSLLRKRSPKA